MKSERAATVEGNSKWRLRTSQRGKVRLDVDLLQQHSGWEVYGQVTPGLFWKEDVRPGCRASPAVGRCGLEQHLCWLCCRAAGGDGACTQPNTSSWRKADNICCCKMVDKPGRSVGAGTTGRTLTLTHTNTHALTPTGLPELAGTFIHPTKPYICTRHLQISWNLHEPTVHENFRSSFRLFFDQIFDAI